MRAHRTPRNETRPGARRGVVYAVIAAIVAAGLAGCDDDRAPASAAAPAASKPAPPAARAPRELADELYDLAGQPEPARLRAVRAWKLDRASWDALIVEPYRALYPAYAAAFDAAVPELVAQLAVKRPILARAHFAGDPKMTRAHAITRWALPTLAPARIAELGGTPPIPLAPVFVVAAGRWRAIVGLDAIVHARIAAHAPACADVLTQLDPAGGRCIEAAWAVADAALRAPQARLTRSCALATNLCGKSTR